MSDTPPEIYLDTPRDVYKAMTVDDLAATILALKEQINAIKLPLDYCEAELRDRLIANNAKHLLGEAYRIKSSVKREIVWDQAALTHARAAAVGNGVAGLFERAFPMKFECSVVNMNALLKLGGKVAEAIENSKIETKEKVYLSYDRLPSG